MKLWKYFILLLLLIAICLWLAALGIDDDFHLVVCNVGQGDATLIRYKSTEILVDGGPTDAVIDCLSKHVPFWDRELELVILTHPEADHFTGLIEVFRRYKVEAFLRSELILSNQNYQVLEKAVGGTTTRVITPTNGLIIRLGLIHLDMVIDEEYLQEKNLDKLNMFSIITLVGYGDFEALLTGDYEFEGRDEFLKNLTKIIPQDGVDYIKIPHHGSKNGLTRALLEITKPKLAVISVGKNQWGHPVPEIFSMLDYFKVKILRTDKEGNIVISSDGTRSWIDR